MHHDYNMEKDGSNVYGYSNGLMIRAQAKQLQSSLISQISMTKASMSLKTYKTFENNIKLFNISFKEFSSLFFHFQT